MPYDIYANHELDVFVESFTLLDHPARLETHVRVKDQTFFSRVTYHSINAWGDVWSKLGDGACQEELLGALAAWDCMRFLALGGCRLVLCDGLALANDVRETWRHCFLNQLGEWRYRNKIGYAHGYPRVEAAEPTVASGSSPASAQSGEQKWLLTNGGGKDTLVGMLLLNEANLKYDVYEGALPLGGQLSEQRSLLRTLRQACCPLSELVEVTVEDDFFASPRSVFERLGVSAAHYLSDFAVGHTANYVGYFPVILHGGYSGVWFNVEASADRVMATWCGEAINHQWCKSKEYQSISTQLFGRLTGGISFSGFASTLRGLHDSVIYAIASSRPELLRLTHSCNTVKPWCRNCPKCCFSYLMMASFSGEEYAKAVMGVEVSLFDDPSNHSHWQDLLDPSRVAWECVPSHQECHEALGRCLARGVEIGPLLAYLRCANQGGKFHEVNWRDTPASLRGALCQLLERAQFGVEVDVVVVGAGQTGISLSAVLAEEKISHLVLEASEIGASWRNRWDSFQINTPNRTIALPGYAYQGDEPDGFLTAPGVVRLLQGYVHDRGLPVIEACAVLQANGEDGYFTVQTSRGTIRSKCLVVAAGEYKRPRMPRVPLEVPVGITGIHSGEYKSPATIPEGAVLVIGGGQSGAQIVEDLREAGRTVYWSISDRPSNTRRLRGKDFMEWWDIGGIIHRHVMNDPGVVAGAPNALHLARSKEFPLVSGKGGGGLGRSISLRRMADSGVTLLGKLQRISDGRAYFNDVRPQIEKAVSATRAEHAMLQRIADQYYAALGSDESEADSDFTPEEVLADWHPEASPLELHLATSGVRTLIFATGFTAEWSWLKGEGLFDEYGYPIGYDGVSPMRGLFFMGLFNVQRLSSTCLCNGGRDANVLLPHIRSVIASEKGNRPFVAEGSVASARQGALIGRGAASDYIGERIA